MPDATAFARQWADEWNAHDLDSILTHYAPDVVFRSAIATQVLPGSDGTVLDVFEGLDTLVIRFRNEKGQTRAEVLTFRDGLIVEGRGLFLAT